MWLNETLFVSSTMSRVRKMYRRLMMNSAPENRWLRKSKSRTIQSVCVCVLVFSCCFSASVSVSKPPPWAAGGVSWTWWSYYGSPPKGKLKLVSFCVPRRRVRTKGDYLKAFLGMYLFYAACVLLFLFLMCVSWELSHEPFLCPDGEEKINVL